MKNEKCLDVDCGIDKLQGVLGVDRIKLPGVDVVHDLDIYTWPFENDSFDHIVYKYFLGHLHDLIRCMEELYRIGRSRGIVEIIAPHYASDNFNTDPTHKISFGIWSLDYFIDGTVLRERYRYSPVSFPLIKRQISLSRAQNRLSERNKVKSAQGSGPRITAQHFSSFIRTFFVYWIPPSEVYFKILISK